MLHAAHCAIVTSNMVVAGRCLINMKELLIGILIVSIHLFLLGCGSLFFYWSFAELGNCLRARSWEQTPVEIHRLELVPDNLGKGALDIQVNYSYTYGGRQFTSDRFYFAFGKSPFAEKFVSEVRERRPPFAYVNSEDPSEAVLYRELTEKSPLAIPFGAMFMIGSILIGSSFLPWFKDSDDYFTSVKNLTYTMAVSMVILIVAVYLLITHAGLGVWPALYINSSIAIAAFAFTVYYISRKIRSAREAMLKREWDSMGTQV